MHLKHLILTASAIFSAAAFEPKVSAAVFEPKAKDFAGLGQIRTLYIGRGHDDLGCLTSTGKWTADESQCGTFAAEQIGNSTFHLSVPEGGCGVDVATFKCGANVEGAIFGTFGTDGPIAGREVLRYAQYGVVATDATDSPPSLKDGPLEIHFYSGSEKGKWVWLGWKSVDEEEPESEAK